MRLGLSTAAFYGRYETEEAAQIIGGLPLDCAEIFLQTASEYTPAFAGIVKEALAGMPATSVHPLGTQFENGLISRSLRQRRDAMDMFCRVLDAAKELGARIYVYHGRNTPQLTPLPWKLEENLQLLMELGQEAKKRGVTLAWENVFWCQLTDIERVRQVRLAMPQVCFTLDIKQAMRAGCDPVGLARAMGDGLVNVHLCDWDSAGRLCLPGEGSFDFDALFDALCAMRYDGPVILEPYAQMISSRDALLRSIVFLREKMKT